MKKLFKNNNLNKIKCTGFNLVKLINICTCNNIDLNNLIRIDSKAIEFEINDKSLKKLKALDLDEFDIKLINIGGFRKFIKTMCLRMGLVIGFLISIILLFFVNNRLFNIEIMGLQNINRLEVENSLKEYGLSKFSLMNFNKSELENYLSEKFDFSLVSVATKGNLLIINVKEELPEVTAQYDSILAPYNMIITQINIYSGTSRFKKGDIVYKGETLVEAYEINNNERINVIPCAEISGETFFSEKYDFYTVEESWVRTGRYKIISSDILLGKIKVFSYDSDSGFEYFEEVNQNMLLTNYFLPISVNKRIYYELSKEIIERNFDAEKEKIISDLKTKVYAFIPKDLEVDSEEIKISSTNYGNIITIYLKSSVYLKYNIN